MKLHPYMVEAIYLRQHPFDSIVKDTGIELWYCPIQDKFLWTNPQSQKRKGVYEATGLKQWWLKYLRECENMELSELDEEGFQF